jgi:diguanylate cyclase (GGDEF)-like protein
MQIRTSGFAGRGRFGKSETERYRRGTLRKANRLFGRRGSDDSLARERSGGDAAARPEGTETSPGDAEGGETPRTVESMLQEFSGGADALLPVRAGRAGKYDQLWQLSMSDPHTGLVNQLLLVDRLTQALARRRRHGGEVVVFHVDLDNLAEINTELGYTTGNTVLREMARRLIAVFRTEDTIARVGGSELVVVLEVTDEQAVGPLTRRLQHTIDEPVVVGARPVRLHPSIGVVLAEGSESADDVLTRADRSTGVGHR